MTGKAAGGPLTHSLACNGLLQAKARSRLHLVLRSRSSRFSVRKTCFFSLSTSITRTSRVCPMKAEFLFLMCRRPSSAVTSLPPLGGVTATKAPKTAMPVTVPLCHCSFSKPSTGGSRVRGLTSDNSILPRSTPIIFTSTGSERLNSFLMSVTMPSLMYFTWSSPSFSAPTSTKTPNLLTPVTLPPRVCPCFKSAVFKPRCKGMRSSITGSIVTSSFPFTSPRIRTVTSSPTVKCSRASPTKTPSRICVLCNKQASSAPMSMKAPKCSTVLTLPFTSCPAVKSRMVLRPMFFIVRPRKLGSFLRTRTRTFCPSSNSSPGWWM
mmetsp:Transcript_97642/g.209515  ORF Transcript_97642/g.209515 Transcript_97642/m.209515 type:complete len:322 (-) Transcript_97642:582-1547(-)